MTKYQQALKVTILWNGGWDKLEIDLDNTRPLTEVEKTWNLGDPCLGDWDWLRMSFLKNGLKNINSAVKIIRRISHGD